MNELKVNNRGKWIIVSDKEHLSNLHLSKETATELRDKLDEILKLNKEGFSKPFTHTKDELLNGMLKDCFNNTKLSNAARQFILDAIDAKEISQTMEKKLYKILKRHYMEVA